MDRVLSRSSDPDQPMGECRALGNADPDVFRTTEFLWQEGHTAHATEGQAREETMLMLETYVQFCRKISGHSGD